MLNISHSRFKPLTKSETEHLVLEMYKGNKNARERLINHYIKFVETEVYNYKSKTDIELEELYQVGNEAMIEAIDEYRLNKKTSLADFIRSRVDRAVDEAIAEDINISNMRFNLPIDNMEDIDNPIEDAVDRFGHEQRMDQINKVLSNCNPVDLHILKLRLGMYDGIPRNNDIIAKAFGENTEYVENAVKRIIMKVRSKFGIENTEIDIKDLKYPKLIYNYFKDYSKKNVNLAICSLDLYDKAFLLGLYCDDLGDDTQVRTIDKADEKRLRDVIAELRYLLQNPAKPEDIYMNLTTYDEDILPELKALLRSPSRAITKEEYEEVSEITEGMAFNDIKNILKESEVPVALYKLKAFRRREYSSKALADFFGITEEDVNTITDEALLAYLMKSQVIDNIEVVNDQKKITFKKEK